MADDFDWTTQTIARLRALWLEGHATAEIGRRMQISKNAVVGKAHRLGLPPRPSPIRRDGSDPPRRPATPQVRGPGLPTLPAAPEPAGSGATTAACAPASRRGSASASLAAVLLADRRAWQARLPLLRRRRRAAQALLRRARRASLRRTERGAGPPGRPQPQPNPAARADAHALTA